MSDVGERKQDRVSGRFYREYRGERYWYWPKRGFYVSQKGGKQRMLHREMLGYPGRGYEIVPVNGDWEDYSPGNWECRRKGAKRDVPSKHPFQEFNGIRYYRDPDRCYYSRRFPASEYMHQAVRKYHNGPIPDGFHVHHKDEDKANNHIDNLELLSASDHSRHHGPTNPWIGSEANKRQLRQASEKAKAWHRSPEGREWHREHGRRTMAQRERIEKRCEHCGTAYFTRHPRRSKYCDARCKRAAYKAEADKGL